MPRKPFNMPRKPGGKLTKEEKKEHNTLASREYRKNHPEKVALCKHNNYETHKDKIKERNRKNCKANPQKVIKRSREYYDANPDKMSKRHKAYKQYKKDLDKDPLLTIRSLVEKLITLVANDRERRMYFNRIKQAGNKCPLYVTEICNQNIDSIDFDSPPKDVQDILTKNSFVPKDQLLTVVNMIDIDSGAQKPKSVFDISDIDEGVDPDSYWVKYVNNDNQPSADNECSV